MPQYPLNLPVGAPLSAAITTNAGTQVKTGPGVLLGLTVLNAGTDWTATLYDGVSTGGDELAVVTFSGTGPITFPPLRFVNGLFIQTSGTTPGSFKVARF